MTDLEEARHQIRRAYIRATNPGVRSALDKALVALDSSVPTGLVECPRCGRIGLPEQVAAHEC